MDQVVLVADPVGVIFCRLESLQEIYSNRAQFMGMGEEYTGTYDVVREALGSDVQQEFCQDYIH